MSIYSGKTKSIEVSSTLIDVYDKHGSRYGLTSSRIQASQILDIKVESRFLIVRYGNTFSIKQIGVEFDNTYHASEACQAIQRIIPKSQSQSRGRAEHTVGKALFGVFLGLGATIKHTKEERQKKSQAQREYEEVQQKAIENITKSGHLTVTTFVNGREFKRASGKNAVKAVFLAKYARSPHSVERTWEQEWREKYGINDSWSYLQALVSEGHLEEALLARHCQYCLLNS